MDERNRERLQRAQQRIEAAEPSAGGAPLDPVERLLDDLAQEPTLGGVFLTPNFLNDVGFVLERDGFGAAEAYLLARTERAVQDQARFVLHQVLPRLRACPPVVARRALGRYVIKILPALKERSRPHDPRAGVPGTSRDTGAPPGRRRP